MRYVIHLRPSAEFMRKVAECRDELGGIVTKVPAGPPHLSVYTLEAQPRHEHTMLRELEHAARRHGPLDLQAQGTDLFTDYATHRDDVLVAKVALTDQLHALHLHVADLMRKHVDWSKTRFPPLTPEQELAVREHGSPYAGMLYRPHVTIAHVSERPDIRLEGAWTSSELILSSKDRTGWWGEVAIYNLGKQF